ncbi:TPA: hypothetical protein ACHOXM_005209, partial [Escherichia coli]
RPWAIKLFEEKILPFLINKGTDVFKKGRNVLKLRGQMSECLAKTRAQCSIINSLAFPNVLKKISDIYVPLTLSTLDSVDEKEYLVNRGDTFLKNF